MAHMLEIVNGEAQMAYSGETPWHGLGTKVSPDLTPVQMMKKAGVDWEVEEVEAFIEMDGEKVPTGQKALVRKTDKTILTNVGDGWHSCQNLAAFEFFNEFTLAGDMQMHTAGSLKNGKYVWALAKVNESFDIFGGDQVDSYMLFANPHQYGKAIDVRFTPIRVVCNNTLAFALNKESVGARAVKVSHGKAFDPDLVKMTMGLAHEKFAKYKEMAEFLGSKRFSVDNLLQYYNEVFPLTSGEQKEVTKDTISRPARQAYDVLETQPGAEFAEGSWWQAANSVTFMTDHLQGRNADNRLYNQWFGTNQSRKIKAMEKAVEYANAS